MTQENWCECKGHLSHDFGKLTDFYCEHFIPTGWRLKYTTLLEPEDERFLYMTGVCSQCGGFMRSGISIAEYTHDNLLKDVCQAMLSYRPYAGRDESGLYRAGIPQRLEWYWKQDQLTKAARIEQFTALFHEKDQLAASRWAEEHMPTPDARRETSTEFFKAVVEQVQADGFWPEQSAFIACEPACPSWLPAAVISCPAFAFCPVLTVEPDGILCIDCRLKGKCDNSGRRELLIGRIRAACTGRDTCLIMGSLTGALLYYGKSYRDANLERYVYHKGIGVPRVQFTNTEGE